jgi:sortase A
MRVRVATVVAAGVLLVPGLLAGCSGTADAEPEMLPATTTTTTAASPASPGPSGSPTPSGPTPTATGTAEPEQVLATSGRPRAARLSIPALRLSDLRVVPYVGTPDDGPGTVIQDNGSAASPHGSGGLVGPGWIGNYLVTGHRSSSTAPFRELPSLRIGSRIVVETATHRLVYEVVRNQRTSFRSPASLRAQSAAVPGRPGREATRAMITLSTCATFEDHAAGNFWSDEFHNPEHRIEKIGALRSIRRL